MYGTVARMKIKPGTAARMQEYAKSYEGLNVPGQINTYVFQMDADANELYLVAIFDSKEAYEANANDPSQDARFRQMMELLDGEPEWHDGEIIYAMK